MEDTTWWWSWRWRWRCPANFTFRKVLCYLYDYLVHVFSVYIFFYFLFLVLLFYILYCIFFVSICCSLYLFTIFMLEMTIVMFVMWLAFNNNIFFFKKNFTFHQIYMANLHILIHITSAFFFFFAFLFSKLFTYFMNMPIVAVAMPVVLTI